MNAPNPSLLRRPAGPILLGIFALCLGVAIGLGAHTFRYAKGLSYFSREPSACANCHIMQSQYDSWQKSSHHISAKCIDCHLPASFVPKYVAKAENGWRHSKEFTLETFAEPIRLKPRSRAILLENCAHCHGTLTAEMTAASAQHDASADCLHCHSTVGHGVRAALGGPLPFTHPASTVSNP